MPGWRCNLQSHAWLSMHTIKPCPARDTEYKASSSKQGNRQAKKTSERRPIASQLARNEESRQDRSTCYRKSLLILPPDGQRQKDTRKVGRRSQTRCPTEKNGRSTPRPSRSQESSNHVQKQANPKNTGKIRLTTQSAASPRSQPPADPFLHRVAKTK